MMEIPLEKEAVFMDPTQTLELAQALKLSPTLLQSMNILQMTTLELSAYLKDLALENPVLEEQEGGTSWEEFAHQVSWLADQPGPSGGEAVGEPGRIDQETGYLSFLLEEQLDRLKLDQKILAVCRYLVGLLDDRGWLDPADLEGLMAAGVPEALLEQALKTLQSLDPAGIGARNLGECLTLQLDRLPGDAPVARAICAGHLDQLGREAYAAIARELGVSLPQVREAANVIRALDPAPGREEELSQPVEYVRPDAWVAVIDGELRVFTNQWDLPQFHLSEQYLQLANGKPGDEATEYLRQKIQQARWVLQCVQRRQGTLQRCLEAMVQAQADYFWERADAPRPLLRRDLADQLEVHPSTVTRALAHKYLQCRQGLFPTGYFFGRATGAGEISAQQAKAALLRWVRAEDPKKPLSDQALTEALAGEGMPLARRTVAKYRKALGLPPAYRRKR